MPCAADIRISGFEPEGFEHGGERILVRAGEDFHAPEGEAHVADARSGTLPDEPPSFAAAVHGAHVDVRVMRGDARHEALHEAGAGKGCAHDEHVAALHGLEAGGSLFLGHLAEEKAEPAKNPSLGTRSF